MGKDTPEHRGAVVEGISYFQGLISGPQLPCLIPVPIYRLFSHDMGQPYFKFISRKHPSVLSHTQVWLYLFFVSEHTSQLPFSKNSDN